MFIAYFTRRPDNFSIEHIIYIKSTSHIYVRARTYTRHGREAVKVLGAILSGRLVNCSLSKNKLLFILSRRIVNWLVEALAQMT